MTFRSADSFEKRHIGPYAADLQEMLSQVGARSLESLMTEIVPTGIRNQISLRLPVAESESEYLDRMRRVAELNVSCRSFIGLGYYGTITPSVILRNVLENPAWYTPYTPYQAEIAQGRLEALLNFQTAVEDLTAMEVANASLLDEATAAAEAMALLHRIRSRQSDAGNVFLVSDRCFSQTVEVLRGRAEPLGLDVRMVPEARFTFDDNVFGALLQYPDGNGEIRPLDDIIEAAHESGVLVAVATDLLALTLLKPPGESGADVVFGSAQRFGVPMGYGGPHAAFFATRREYVRQIPGRLIGVSVDRHGRQAYRMALQTREQHIRRERATSNICTAQALLANVAGFYAVYHGADGLREIARRIHETANELARRLSSLGASQTNVCFFDTLRMSLESSSVKERLRDLAETQKFNFRYFNDFEVGICLDETTTSTDVDTIVSLFAETMGCQETEPLTPVSTEENDLPIEWPAALVRQSDFLNHPVFNSYRSELKMMRYLKQLERKDIGLDTSMIPLGSCTMKLTSATELIPVTWKEFSNVHPYVPVEHAAGYHQIFDELSSALCAITGFPAVSLQPNSGAQGEFAGLMVIRAYHQARGDQQRDVVLIPSSAHGTNPASAAMAGMQIVIVKCDDQGNVNVSDLGKKVAEFSDRLNALMITYPSTHGVFEESVQEICQLVHKHGGQVYMDGANMNAQVGITSPAVIGADVCHLNLHKTFAIPHGGGGPGMGPIAVAEHLSSYLPGHSIVKTGGNESIRSIAAAPWGSASVLLISHAYVCLLGSQGMTKATQVAMLNANYIKSRLKAHFDVLYMGENGRVAHELIFDLRPFRESAGVTEQDVAKRLMDFGFHAPTVSFPVQGTLMVEPTESEPREELDRFCSAMVKIREEIQAIVDGKADRNDNLLLHAPHTAEELTVTDWTHPYSRQEAAFPLSSVRTHKYWPPISRIDDAYGDRNLMCACPPVGSYDDGSE